MAKINFELGKNYEVSFPDGSVLVVKFIGGEPPRFQTEDGSIVGNERLNGYSSIKEVPTN